MSEGTDPLARLRAWESLEVGPVTLEPRRLRMPYAVVSRGCREETELRYRWPEEVFDPADPADRNLASVIGAQVALNYGLFCDRIVFRGPFDGVDRRFLVGMAENTAREIYVKKFLEPNPFLEDAMRAIPAVRRRRYARAEMLFPDALADGVPPRVAPPLEVERIAVLSSGGKDSLLSYAVLSETGRETHSIFVNESGHHWTTALNAYRFLAEHAGSSTARVWTSSDRLFSWFLDRLPFVRRDFRRRRSDDYPIRLWSVAVFLFGALPVLRRRGIGRLVIGNEYDTSRRAGRAGIPHYDGLYDQSRWFDEALSRYCSRKNWPFRQFSLLRPCSELLIQKLLAERYPELQRHQISCHAATLRQGTAVPCGNCEKCRRIVAMLVALGHDPGACGYPPGSIQRCVAAFARRGVHQERAVAEHVAWLLRSRDLWPPENRPPGGGFSRGGGPLPRPHPEVLSLRFHPRISPAEVVPEDLRDAVFRLLLSGAAGAVRRSGGEWVPIREGVPT